MRRAVISAAQLAVVMPFAIALGVYTAQSGNAWPAWICVVIAAAFLAFGAWRQH